MGGLLAHPAIRNMRLLQLLDLQFREQSSRCDVIIKVGVWEKRFHWRVLVYSPFFKAIYRSNFLEKQTGIIELHRWPASIVEKTLLYLYGRVINVKKSNVDQLLDISEFLSIPELKWACIDHLKKAELTVDNCTHLLQLSSVYRFRLTKCQSFIMDNLPQVLEQEGMLNVTLESVKMLMADPKQSNVPVQTWFDFIIRWVKKAPERLCQFVELFHMLDFGGCDCNFISNIVAREPLVVQHKEELDKLMTP